MYNDILDDIEEDISGDWKDIKRDIDYKKRKECYNEFFKLADDLIELNKKRRKFFNANIPIEYYTKEYCTVKIDIGRISGKTEYILRNINSDDLLIVFSYGVKSFLKKQERLKNVRIITADELIYSNRYNNIWVDNASYIHKKINIDILYSKFSHSREQTFIFLG